MESILYIYGNAQSCLGGRSIHVTNKYQFKRCYSIYYSHFVYLQSKVRYIIQRNEKIRPANTVLQRFSCKLLAGVYKRGGGGGCLTQFSSQKMKFNFFTFTSLLVKQPKPTLNLFLRLLNST